MGKKEWLGWEEEERPKEEKVSNDNSGLKKIGIKDKKNRRDGMLTTFTTTNYPTKNSKSFQTWAF